ncbi:MAG: MoaD/ThiS family protein [Kofleriaceae bacterium]
MATVELTRHLVQFFPQLADDVRVEGTTVAEVIAAVERVAPGFAFYVCDERGRLRRHVNVFVDGLSVGDRAKLTDPVGPASQVMIMQALSGG